MPAPRLISSSRLLSSITRRSVFSQTLCTAVGACGFLLAANTAHAQLALRQTPTLDEDNLLNAADCDRNDTLTARWILDGAEESQYFVRGNLYTADEVVSVGTDRSCPDLRLVEGELFLPQRSIDVQGTTLLVDLDLNPADIMSQAACTGDGFDDSIFLCLYVFSSINDNLVVYGIGEAALPLVVDTIATDAPTQALTGRDQAISANMSGFGSASTGFQFAVQARACASDDSDDNDAGSDAGSDADAGANDGTVADPSGTEVSGSAGVESKCDATGPLFETIASSLPVVVSGLTNGAKYEARSIVIDEAGNRSEASALAVVTPEFELTPMAVYDGASNPWSFDPEDCNSSSSTALIFGGVLLGWQRLRRAARSRRAGFGNNAGLLVGVVGVGTALAGASLSSSTAHADVGQTTFSIKVGGYKPAIDTERKDSGTIFPIYQCFFSGSTLPQFGFDFDIHLFDEFGSLQAGLGLGFAHAVGYSPTEQPQTGLDCVPNERGALLGLSILQVKPQLTYRFDWALDEYHFPLVPYVRGGLVGSSYLFTKDGSFDSGNDDQNPVGLRLGYEGALGMMLSLEFMDQIDPWTPHVVKRARSNGVYENVFFFVEASYQDISGLGTPGLVLSPSDVLLRTSLPWMLYGGFSMELL